MFASTQRSRGQRRGVVLVVILGMLGLLALIGVTFATFAGQSQVGTRIFSQSKGQPDASELMDYALSQLIDDTNNPMSALRGHSLKRDMYGNDATNNGYLDARPDLANYPPQGNALFYVTATQIDITTGLLQYRTNIPAQDPAFYGYDFTRWVMRVPLPAFTMPGVGQTIE